MDDDEAKRRLLIYTAVRFACVALVIFGVAVVYSNVLRRGGWPQLGAILCIVGAVASIAVPHALKRKWDRRQP